MLLFKLAERSLGLISTIFLARLLAPTDFGMVAMAMSFVLMAQLLAAFGFDVALIRDQSASEDHYHTAWTLNVCLGLAITILMLLLADPVARFYGKPELYWVVLALAFSSLFSGLENIGVVAFRKELRFGYEFAFQVSRKLIAFLVTIPLAFLLRNHWALVAGTLTASCAATLISYSAHPFRPHFSIAKARDLLVFSRWLLIGNIISFVRERSSDFFIGRLAGPAALGTYNVAYEISNLPTTELSAPINRALLPGLSKQTNEPSTLRATYMLTFSLLALASIPAAVGILGIAHWLVPLFLGSKWMDAVALIQILAISGVLQVLQSSSATALIATGNPKAVFTTNALYACILLSGLALLVPAQGAVGASIAVLLASIAATPVFLLLVRRNVGVPLAHFARHLWRPAVASALMYAILSLALPQYDPGTATTAAALYVAGGVVIGAASYLLLLFVLWLLSGKPSGGEHTLLAEVRARLPRRTQSRPPE